MSEYRGHKVTAHLNDREYATLKAEAARQGKRMGAVLRETFLRAMSRADGECGVRSDERTRAAIPDWPDRGAAENGP